MALEDYLTDVKDKFYFSPENFGFTKKDFEKKEQGKKQNVDDFIKKYKEKHP